MGDTEMVIERKSLEQIHREIDQIFSHASLKGHFLQILSEGSSHMKPTLVMLNNEWGVMEKLSAGTHFVVRTYIHYCPGGDVRVAQGKVCELCRVQVPEAVQFMARVLST